MRFEKLRTARIRAGYTLAHIAQATGHGQSWVWAVERGLIAPSGEDARRISELLGIKVGDLFRRVREEEIQP